MYDDQSSLNKKSDQYIDQFFYWLFTKHKILWSMNKNWRPSPVWVLKIHLNQVLKTETNQQRLPMPAIISYINGVIFLTVG